MVKGGDSERDELAKEWSVSAKEYIETRRGERMHDGRVGTAAKHKGGAT